ncbi:MAG: DNA recombination protein RmuC [Alphaproteobacteria bacterium]|nr:DNA recombination protein RmuC [Alphaproteobacteria bacterium]
MTAIFFWQKRTLRCRLDSIQEELRQENNQRQILESHIDRLVHVENAFEQLKQSSQMLSIENAQLKTTLDLERKITQEKSKTLEEVQTHIAETFKNLSNKALLENNQVFLTVAKDSLEKFLEGSKTDLDQRQKAVLDLVSPVQKSLHEVDQKITQLEKERIDAYSDLRRQMTDLLSTQKELKGETASLVKALRSPTTRGQWGEMQLKRVVEMAGMISHCDFIEQSSSEDGRFRPDMIVRLPGSKQIIVDSKTPLAAYLESIESTTDAQRLEYLDAHARQVRSHIRILSGRAYWEQFSPTPEFVVMFLPGEAFFSAALERDPSLIEYGVKERVILATPTTLIALLRAVAFGWRQESLADNAKAISDLGRELYKRLSDMNSHVGRLGRHIHQVVDSYNSTVGTLERRVMVSARKLQLMDSSLDPKGLDPINSLDSVPRSVQSIFTVEDFPIESPRDDKGESSELVI